MGMESKKGECLLHSPYFVSSSVIVCWPMLFNKGAVSKYSWKITDLLHITQNMPQNSPWLDLYQYCMCPRLICLLWSSRLPLTPIVSFSGSWMNEKWSFNEMRNGHSSKFFSIQCISFTFLVCDPVVFLGSVDTQWDPAVAELLPKKGSDCQLLFTNRRKMTDDFQVLNSLKYITVNKQFNQTPTKILRARESIFHIFYIRLYLFNPGERF